MIINLRMNGVQAPHLQSVMTGVMASIQRCRLVSMSLAAVATLHVGQHGMDFPPD